jgi:hypothetical protein
MGLPHRETPLDARIPFRLMGVETRGAERRRSEGDLPSVRLRGHLSGVECADINRCNRHRPRPAQPGSLLASPRLRHRSHGTVAS